MKKISPQRASLPSPAESRRAKKLPGLERSSDRYEGMIRGCIQQLWTMWCGQRVILQAGRHRGREAEITDVAADGAGARFLCMVLRRDGRGFLNSDPESRFYRPRSEFSRGRQKG